jgi:hypothetical protein
MLLIRNINTLLVFLRIRVSPKVVSGRYMSEKEERGRTFYSTFRGDRSSFDELERFVLQWLAKSCPIFCT